MARTPEFIKQQIITEKNNQPALNPIDLDSQVSELNYWIDVTAYSHYQGDVRFDAAVAELNAKFNALRPGTALWYQEQCFAFQLGDQLQSDGKYAVIDESKQIITRASISQSGGAGVITIKVAKGEVGSESALTSAELLQFTNYMEKIKFAGNTLNIISLNADKLKLEGSILFDGILSLEVIKERAQVAYDDFLQNRVAFDGKVRVNYIIDSLQKVDGLVDVELTTVTAFAGLAETVFTMDYDTVSGYIKEHEDFPFVDTLVFIPVYN